ncbi:MULTISPECIES: acyl-CoA dehydrogenase family protein [Nocardia]|uniref:acyl-CoA dehydrogenase family protein n=1 Tax=Nocardia TaxID=1817 RepID=UPI000D697420|nr:MULTISPECIES: acyl-CoA dehydrogenase family protein [Nocardia]
MTVDNRPAETDTDELTLDDLDALTTLVGDVLAEVCTPDRLADPAGAAETAWRALDEVGVTRLGLCETGGGHGADLSAATAVLRVVGEHAAPGPLAETSLLGGRLLEAAGLAQPSGPVTTGPATLVTTREGTGRRVRGTVRRVPAAPGATTVAIAVGDDGEELLVLLPDTGLEISHGHNLAREPRDTITIDIALDTAHPLPVGTARELRLRGGLSRAALSAGALIRVRDRTLAYAGERVQFGHPLSAFQAVQHQLARLVAETAAANAAVDQAVRAALRCGFADPHTELVVAAAKVRTAQAATLGPAVAHQIHAALGMTEEHPLHHSTTRLWSWRSEWGNEASWSETIADRAIAAGSTGLWPFLTGIPGLR